MDAQDDQSSSVKSGAVRAKLHRERRKDKEVQLAVGVAKIVLGQGAGEQRNAVRDFLLKVVDAGELPDDYMRALERAVERLKSRSSL
jgi:hypothetical protein